MTVFPRFALVRAFAALLGGSLATAAPAQRSGENVITSAQDAFGVTLGNDRIGIYSAEDVRGFNPQIAGNIRLDSLYFDMQGMLGQRAVSGNTVRVGIGALGYPFSAPSGIVDYALRPSSPGESALSASVQAGPLRSRFIELDGRTSLIEDRWGVAAGFGLRRQENSPGAANDATSLFLASTLAFGRGARLQPFVATTWITRGDDSQPTIFVAGTYLPPVVPVGDLSQAWTDTRRRLFHSGLSGLVELRPGMTLRAGLFRSLISTETNFSDLYLNTTAQGVGTHVIVASPSPRRDSVSGEARLTTRLSDGVRTHGLHLMVRGRLSSGVYGGSANARLADQPIARFIAYDEPTFAFSAPTRDTLRQLSGGIGYELRWPGIGELSVGWQKSRYRKTVKQPLAAPAIVANDPGLPTGTLALFLTRRLSAYASYAKGLEDNGIAPDVAANRGEPLPAVLTSQREVGLRYQLGPGLSFIAGAFDLRRPYFALDTANLFVQSGSIRNRGVELSLAGQLAKGLTIVGGAVLMRPQVTGEAVRLGRIGPKPVGVTSQLARLNLDYRPPGFDRVSFDLGVAWAGPIAASRLADAATGRQVDIPSRAAVDLGTRYRFAVGGHPSVLRLQALNAFDAAGWRVTPAGGFQRQDPRRFLAVLTTDF